MNPKILRGIASRGIELSSRLERCGPQMLAATYDWQSPLRGGGTGPGCKGDHSDPTVTTVLTPDPNTLLYKSYLRLLLAKERADADLYAFHVRHDPLTEDQITRGRVSSVPACIDCQGPATPARAGRCDRCRKRWERNGRPDSTTSQRQHQAELAAAATRLHEHEATDVHH